MFPSTEKSDWFGPDRLIGPVYLDPSDIMTETGQTTRPRSAVFELNVAIGVQVIAVGVAANP